MNPALYRRALGVVLIGAIVAASSYFGYRSGRIRGKSEALSPRERLERSRAPAGQGNAATTDGARQVTRGQEESPARRRPAEVAPPKGGGTPTVLFVVMDTVRAQNLSLCGYERPTSPFLEQLRDKTGAAWTCNAYAAATWTVPSHASYFTGLTVPTHESDTMGFRFSKEIPTLSEKMSAKGYQSVMFTANPTLSVESGLQRGFEYVRAAKTLVDFRKDDVALELRGLLDEVDEEQPLFLFVNLIDAHDPYPRIPSDVGWVPPRPELPFEVHAPDRDDPYHRFVRGELSPQRAESFLSAIRDGYDYGIYLADQNVNAVMQLLRREGWLGNGFRVVITSDHGEFLGEHQLLRHGCYTWEPVTKVPFLYYDSDAETQIDLPEPFSAINAFSLVLDGKLPEEPLPVTSFSKRRRMDVKVGADMASLWLPDSEKLIWKTDEFLYVDLAQDPGELNPENLASSHPHRSEIEEMAEAHAEHLERVRSATADPALLEALAAIGYVE